MPGETDFAAARRSLANALERQENLSPSVAEAIATVPREAFVPDSQRSDAYADRPLPIGEEQTISAPHMVAIMADRLDLSPGDRVLEIGTGCGYHAAVTAELVGADQVFSVEYFETLAAATRERLDRLGYDGISIRQGNGAEGWPAHAPYDVAYLTCAAEEFPPAVVEQVRPGGRLLAPLGNRTQWLVAATKRSDGALDRSRLSRVRFVRMQEPR